MTNPTDTERLLAEARDSRQFWRDGWIALDRDNVALAAKVRELEGERIPDGHMTVPAAVYRNLIGERDETRAEWNKLKAKILELAEAHDAALAQAGRGEVDEAMVKRARAAYLSCVAADEDLDDLLHVVLTAGLWRFLAANQPAKGQE